MTHDSRSNHEHDHEHDHEHSHEHGSRHGHGHDHHDHGGSEGEGMPFEEKLAKILEHWVRHNNDHVSNYRDWAERARKADMPDVAELLDEAAGLNLRMNEVFEKAKSLVSGRA